MPKLIIETKDSLGIRPGDMVEYRMGARMLVDATIDTVFLEFSEGIKEIPIDEISLLNVRL